MLWIAVTATLVIAARIARHGQPQILAFGIVCSGICAGQLAAFYFPLNHIALFTTDEPCLAWAELEFSEAPRLMEESGPRPLPPRQVGMARVRAIKTWKGWEPAKGDVLFSMSGAEPRIKAGMRVRVFGMLQRPAPAMNPGQFDWEAYYRRDRVLASVRAGHAWDVEVVARGSEPIWAGVRAGVREWLGLGFTARQQVDRGLLAALLLGDRGPEIHGVQDDFQKTGTSHLLSSSGVRMSVLAGLVYLVCRLMCIGPRWRVLVVMAAILIWGGLTLPSAQALRPAIVAGALGAGLLGRRRVDSLQLLALAAIFILLARPLDVYGAGFQLSFGIVLGMLLLVGPLLRFLRQYENTDEAVLEKLRRLTPRQRARRWIVRRLVQAFAVAMVAWVVSIPLVAYHFGQFTPWAVPIGLLLSPVVFAALAAGFVKIAITILVPGWAGAWACFAGAPVAALRHAIALCAHLPGADIPVSAPPIWMIALFYALLLLPLLPHSGKAARSLARCGPVGACALMLLMPWLLGFSRQVAPGGSLRITLLSVGAGQCAAVEPPGGGMVFVDAGSSTLNDPLHSCIEPFLRSEGRRQIDSVFLSHGDYDHISAVRTAWGECGIHEVITSPHFRKHAIESVPCRRLLEMLDRAGHPPRQIFAGQTFNWSGGTVVQVLWPPQSCEMNSNNAGVVLRVTYGGRSILFPADIQDPAMQELLVHPQQLKSDVLVAAHHGSNEALTSRFVDAVDPAVIISSNASRLTKKQRDFEQNIHGRRLYRTSRCGAVSVEFDRDGRLVVTPFLVRGQQKTVVEGNLGSVNATRRARR
ncbi:MAG TPA: ComEC/Rec2 family competence protein [Tepidisphaeraceae bacterium]|nr:ComEC/Rec2 family competence protein [Tepidisphaeraceae bacterium]